jgi:hypothetical protein
MTIRSDKVVAGMSLSYGCRAHLVLSLHVSAVHVICSCSPPFTTDEYLTAMQKHARETPHNMNLARDLRTAILPSFFRLI